MPVYRSFMYALVDRRGGKQTDRQTNRRSASTPKVSDSNLLAEGGEGRCGCPPADTTQTGESSVLSGSCQGGWLDPGDFQVVGSRPFNQQRKMIIGRKCCNDNAVRSTALNSMSALNRLSAVAWRRLVNTVTT